MSLKITSLFLISTAVILLLYFIIRRRDLRKFMREDVEFALDFKYKPLVEKGSHNLLDPPAGATAEEGTCNNSNNHFLIYGGSGTGKTYWLKKNYIEKFNTDYRVYGRDKGEWDSSRMLTNLNQLEKLENVTIIFDDVELEIKGNNLVDNLFLSGRHNNVQCIIIAHTTKIISNKIRQNINKILVTTGNSSEFYKQLKEVYGIHYNIEEFKEPYSMILYNIITGKAYMADPNGNVSNAKVGLAAYRDKYNFTWDEELEIKEYLERTSTNPVDIPHKLIPFYKAMYFLSIGQPQNIEKLKHIICGKGNFADVTQYVDQIPGLIQKLDSTVKSSKSIYTTV